MWNREREHDVIYNKSEKSVKVLCKAWSVRTLEKW